GDLGRPGRDPFGQHAVVPGEDGDGHRLGHRGGTLAGDAGQLGSGRLQAPQRPPGLGQAVLVGAGRGHGRLVQGGDGHGCLPEAGRGPPGSGTAPEAQVGSPVRPSKAGSMSRSWCTNSSLLKITNLATHSTPKADRAAPFTRALRARRTSWWSRAQWPATTTAHS